MGEDEERLARKLREFDDYLSFRREHFCQINSSGELDRIIELIDARATPAQIREVLVKYSHEYRPR